MGIDNKQLSEIMRELGKRGGLSKSPAKVAATRINAAKARAARHSRRAPEGWYDAKIERD